MSPWLILLTAVIFAVLNNLFLHKFGNRDIKNTGDILLFNSMISLIWAVIMLVWGIAESGRFVFPSGGAVLYGILYGINLSFFLLFKMQSLATGPVSITSLIASCSFIVPTIFSVFYNSEKVGIIQLLGMAVMLAALFMCMDRRDKSISSNKQWKIFVLMFFCAGGMIGIINKLFQASDAKTEINSMMLVASIVSAIVLAAEGFAMSGLQKTGLPKIYKSGIFYILICGIVSCVYNRLNVYLAGVMPGALLFPISNGSLIFLNTLTGVFIFKEKLSKIQIAGIIVGFLSIIMIGCF